MGGMTTGNSTALIRSQVWTPELKESLKDELQALGFVRYLPDFLGTTLNIPSIGEATVRDYVEDQAVVYDALDTGNFTFTINKYIQSGNYITEKARQDLFYAQQLEAEFVPKERRAIMESIETAVYAITQDSNRGGQTTANANTINGADHRWVGNGSNETMDITDFARANYSLNKANVPETNRVAIVDQSVGYKLQTATNIVNLSNPNPQWAGVINTGLAKNMRFITNIYGFDVYVSNYLPTANETIGSKATTAGK
ncbi:MAG: hypothetical protein ACE5H1_00580, partial [Thermodesulfobacteriota bacterium]